MKKIIIISLISFLILAVIFGVFLGLKFLPNKNFEEKIVCPEEKKVCPDGSYVSKVLPNCDFEFCPGEKEGILVYSPKRNEKIKSPIKIEGQARGIWFFEGEFNANLYDDNGNFLGTAILTAKDDWMTENFVPFEGKLEFIQPSTSLGTLRFLSSDPSGLSENRKIFDLPIQFEKVPYRKVLLYYYNPEKDKDESGNIKCSKDGLVAIEREIPVSKTPIQDTIKFLLKGKENLKKDELDKGITTEYPLVGFSLTEANFKPDGTLILKFDDPYNQTSGGSCRINILKLQIEATAKQFSGVKKVQFLPEELFQP
jgi:hypothetical protein